jgi:hypothetical protein
MALSTNKLPLWSDLAGSDIGLSVAESRKSAPHQAHEPKKRTEATAGSSRLFETYPQGHAPQNRRIPGCEGGLSQVYPQVDEMGDETVQKPVARFRRRKRNQRAERALTTVLLGAGFFAAGWEGAAV